ncbi:MAG: epoxide hydrolase [Rhodocyclaceae bacterium]|nr:epoxide hydrolase [Rhodocyclaceae bacterium]
MTDSITPFKIAIGDAQLDDLKRRLRATRWPDKETPGDWSQGIPLQYMQEVVAYWAETYDWRAREASLNRFEQFRTTIDGLGIHFIHHRSPHPGALPLLMTHGWPGSIVEFQKVIGALADPTTYGGSASDAFHVVCPSLPGFAFSDKPAAPGWNVERIGRAWGVLMQRLGYIKYVAQGGDWGAIITTAIGLNDTANCLGIHLNMPIVMPDPQTMGDLTDQEKSALAGLQHYTDVDSAYAKQQATRPQTLGFGLADSPSGQAAWILEKFWAWTDCNSHPENVLSRDEMLDNVMLYWLTNSGASSARIYWESMHAVNRDPVMIPTGISMFPKEIFRCSKRWAEKRFQNLVYWNELGKGGHFAALEQPALFIDEVRNCFRLMR